MKSHTNAHNEQQRKDHFKLPLIPQVNHFPIPTHQEARCSSLEPGVSRAKSRDPILSSFVGSGIPNNQIFRETESKPSFAIRAMREDVFQVGNRRDNLLPPEW
jgi:hypothetical protein